MERLTDCAQGYCEMYCKKYGHCFGDPGDCIFKDEIKLYEAVKSIEGIVPFDRLLELACADKAGRLVLLPVRTKETVYVVGEKRIMECFIAEAYIDDARGLEYMVSFDCDDNCDGCPFNSWRLDWSGEYSCDGEYGESCILGSDFEKTFFLTREEAEAVLAQKGGTHEADTV